MRITEALTKWIHSRPEQAATVKNALTVCMVGIVSCVNIAYYRRSLQGRTSLLTTAAALLMTVPLYKMHRLISDIISGEHCTACKADKYFNTLQEQEKTYLQAILNKIESSRLDPDDMTAEAKEYWEKTVWQNPAAVEYLFVKGMPANIMDSGGNTLFHLAAPQGNQDTMEILLKYGADINANYDRFPHLHIATFDNQHNTMKILLRNGAKIDAQNNAGHTPLHLAARWGAQQDTMEILIENQASIDAEDNERHTPLHLAAYCGNLVAIKFLIERGADVLLRGSMRLPSEIAGYCGGWTEAAVYLANEERNKKEEKEKNTPKVETFSGRVRPPYKARNKKEVVEVQPVTTDSSHSKSGPRRLSTVLHETNDEELAIDLLNKGVNREAQDQEGCTPLHKAAESGEEHIITILSEWKVNMEALDDEGRTPFLRAAAGAKPTTLQLLLKLGANKDAQTRGGLTALHLAALNGNQENVAFLLENGADIEKKDDKGQTPLHLAAQEKLKEPTSDGSVYWNGNTLVRILEVIPQTNLGTIRYLVKNGQAKIDAQDEEGKTPLAIVIEHQNLKAAQLLLNLGANMETTDNRGRTPIAIACSCLNLDAIKELLSRGVNRETTDNKGKTLLNLIDEHSEKFQFKKSEARELLQAPVVDSKLLIESSISL